MNIRKNIDYSGLYAEIGKAIAAGFSQMELYLELGRLVSDRPEKGAAVMAAEYITANYPNRIGFSPRNLRRMRDFYRMYEGRPEILAQAMQIGWTQNIVIMEADLNMDTRLWYLRAVKQFGWSKVELAKQIANSSHLEKSQNLCYTDGDDFVQEMAEDDKGIVCQQPKQLSKHDRPINNEKAGTGCWLPVPVRDRFCCCGIKLWDAPFSVDSKSDEKGRDRFLSDRSSYAPKSGLQQVQLADQDGSLGLLENVPYLRRRLFGQDVPALGLHWSAGRCYRTTEARGVFSGIESNPRRLSRAFGAVTRSLISCYGRSWTKLAGDAYG